MISQTSEYALRAVVHLAQNHPSSMTANAISEAIQVPTGYLQKVLRMLSKTNLLVSQRGTGGGFSLARLPSAIRVLDVLKATDYEFKRIENCPLGIEGHTDLCALHHMLDAQIASVEAVFATTSIADLLKETASIRPLCKPNSQRPINANIDPTQLEKKSAKNSN
ncbi:MAG: RrF2 family transcriptional regulator [Phycisphaerales bacterium JB043]